MESEERRGPGRSDPNHGPRTGAEHRKHALVLARDIGFVDTRIVSQMLWPDDSNARKYAERLLSRLSKEQVLLRRPLDRKSGIFVLTKAGAFEVGSRPQTQWGRHLKGELGDRWLPPTTFVHDRRAAWFGCWMARFGWRPVFERQYRDGASDQNVPDCLLVDPAGEAVWVEVENSQKNSADREEQIEGAIRRFHKPRKMDTPWGLVTVRRTIWVLPPQGWKDSRGYAIDHEPALRREWAAALAAHIKSAKASAEFDRRSLAEIAAAGLPWRSVKASVWRETTIGFEKAVSLSFAD
jgi:hypothetical protein